MTRPLIRPLARRAAALSLCLGALTAATPAQDGALDPFAQALGRGQASLEAGRGAEALHHLQFALERAPMGERRVVLSLLLQAAALAEDADAQWLWAETLVSGAADERGRWKPEREESAALPGGDAVDAAAALRAVADARADAVRELLRFRDQQRKSPQPGAPFLAEWAEDTARRLLVDAEADTQFAHWRGKLDPGLAVTWKQQDQVISAMEKLIRSAQTAGDLGMVVRAARCLRGMTAQANFPELQGERPPGLGGAASLALDALGDARRRMRNDGSSPYTVEQLEDMDVDERRAFTLRHASFADPGVAESPNKRYRIETDCGHGTLLGTAESVELHHRRLVSWFGEDPFLDRQGIVRVVPESYGLEEEGAGFWWVGGFQGGDETTVKFTMSNIPSLGRIITHELTHRFDGAIYPGMPACFAEGRAVWTGANYGYMEDEEFVEDYVNFATMREVRRMGYAELEELEKLIDGEIEEYRDNYPAGYALFVFLRSWRGLTEVDPEDTDKDGNPLRPDMKDGPPIFARQMELFLRGGARARGKASARFAKLMADGEEGRPESMEEFARLFEQFLRGFDGPRLARFTRIYTPVPPGGEAAPQVMDEPTFSWLRARAEPYFGQDQARLAANLLREAGEDKDALKAHRWALAVDEPSDAVMSEIEELLAGLGQDEAAWAVAHWPRFRSPARKMTAAEPTGFALGRELPALLTLYEAQKALVAAADEAGAARAATAFAADHDLLAALLDEAPLDRRLPEPPVADEEEGTPPPAGHPFHRPARLLTADAWHEDGLTGHEDRRVEGLWLTTPQGDVHVGRNVLRGGTDTMDRNAAWRDAFLLSDRWMEPGRYRVKMQVEQTTAMFTGGIVLGYTRRDRQVRFEISGGDVDFATGRTAQRESGGGVSWSLDGMYARGGGMNSAFAFDSGGTTFALEFLVDGPTVIVIAQGREIGRFTTLDARPIQGHIGFYTSYGALRIVTPTVERLDREIPAGRGGAEGGGLDPWRPGQSSLRELVGRPVNGVPLAPAGTAILWFPEEKAERIAEVGQDGWRTRIDEQARRFLREWQVELPAQGVTIVLPDAFDRAEADDLRAALEAEEELMPKGGLRWSWHGPKPEMAESRMTVGGWTRPLLAFADPAGVLRAARRMSTTGTAIPDVIFDLLEVYQDHSRPGMAGAAD